ncbi:MAG: hypothetical protein CMA31_00460 [Euryarchaeota archaeon]|nr:hypothetical protein [Euryarchaeota archaeon]
MTDGKKMLVQLPPRRLFTFGCSFTHYLWATWANILGYEFSDAKFYNFGKSGAGNQYIFNMLMQADAAYNFTHEDIVIVQWTNVSREDRYFHAGSKALGKSESQYGAWSTPGNIYTQDVYDHDWMKKYFSEYGAIVRDLAFIKAAQEMLKHKTQWHFLQMNNLVIYANQWDTAVKIEDRPKKFGQRTRLQELRDLYAEPIGNILPSFYDVLFNNNWNSKFKADRKLVNKSFQDGHPHPLEHYDYLKRVFKHEWRKETNDKVGQIQKQWIKLMNDVSYGADRFSIYSQPKRWLDMARYELVMRNEDNIDSRTHR